MYNIYIYTHHLRIFKDQWQIQKRLCCSLQIEVDLACTHLAQLGLTRLTMLGHDHTYLGRWLISSEDANAVSLYVMMFHPSSEGWLINPHLGQLTVQRETCQGWFDAWKQNMALSSLDESEATAWEPFLPLCLGSCASCMLEVTGSIFSGAQGPDRTHVTSFTCQFSILKPQMPCGPGVRIRSPESLCWVVEILGVQTSPMTSKYVHAIPCACYLFCPFMICQAWGIQMRTSGAWSLHMATCKAPQEMGMASFPGVA